MVLGSEVSDHQKTTPNSSHKYQDRALPNVAIQEGDGGSLDAKFGNRIQYAACGVWGVAGADSRVEVNQDLAISRKFMVLSSTVEERYASSLPMHTLRVSEMRCSPRQPTQLHRTCIRLADGSSKVRADRSFMSVSNFACDMVRFCP